MTEPYEQCTPSQGIEVLRIADPVMTAFIESAPPGQETFYVSALVTLGITIMARCDQHPDQAAVKLFLERAIRDLPYLAKVGESRH